MTPPGSSAETPPKEFVKWYVGHFGAHGMVVTEKDADDAWKRSSIGQCWRAAVAAERARCAKKIRNWTAPNTWDRRDAAEELADSIERPENER